jgi:hypothetical protein
MEKKQSSIERKKRAAMAYLRGAGFKGASFDAAANDWLASKPMDVISQYKPIRHDGSMNYHAVINAIFDEIDNVDLKRSPTLATAVQNAHRIHRGKTSQIGDESGMYEPVQ